MINTTSNRARELLPLGTIVRHGMREAYISGVSHCDPARYYVTYTDDATMRDQLTLDEITVLNRNPIDDDRAPPRLQEWIREGRPVS